MTHGVYFNHEKPVTAHDIMWSWSTGYMTTKEAIARLGVEDEMELLEAAHDNQVPIPGTPSDEDISNADAFVKAILKVA